MPWKARKTILPIQFFVSQRRNIKSETKKLLQLCSILRNTSYRSPQREPFQREYQQRFPTIDVADLGNTIKKPNNTSQHSHDQSL